jgi:hypothetical protein
MFKFLFGTPNCKNGVQIVYSDIENNPLCMASLGIYAKHLTVINEIKKKCIEWGIEPPDELTSGEWIIVGAQEEVEYFLKDLSEKEFSIEIKLNSLLLKQDEYSLAQKYYKRVTVITDFEAREFLKSVIRASQNMQDDFPTSLQEGTIEELLEFASYDSGKRQLLRGVSIFEDTSVRAVIVTNTNKQVLAYLLGSQEFKRLDSYLKSGVTRYVKFSTDLIRQSLGQLARGKDVLSVIDTTLNIQTAGLDLSKFPLVPIYESAPVLTMLFALANVPSFLYVVEPFLSKNEQRLLKKYMNCEKIKQLYDMEV